MIASLTAFTHFRRIAIVRHLAANPATATSLARAIGASKPACYRHLDKLERRGVVIRTRDDTYRLARPEPGLAVTLLREALA